MSTPPGPRDPFAGIDPETWEILASQQGVPATASAPAVGVDGPGVPREPRAAGAAGLPSSARAASLAATLAMAVLLVAAALLDPSGLAAPIAWAGTDPVPSEPWTWLQHVLQGPLVVLLLWAWARRLLRAATPAAPRGWVLSRTWLLAVLALMVAKLVYSVIWMAPALLGGAQDGLPPETTWPWLVWATGFAGVKGLALGWIPALAAALAWRSGRARAAGAPADVVEPSLALVPAGLVALAVALVAPWLGQHWWSGSPVGYAYTTDWRLLAPVPGSGPVGATIALLVVVLALAGSIRVTLRRVPVPRPGGALRLAGAMGALAAGLALAVVASVVHLVAGTDLAGGEDQWILPATFLRLLEGLSFGLLAAPVAALAVWLVPRAPRPQWTPIGVLVGGAVVVAAAVLVVRGDFTDRARPLAGPDPAPVAMPAASPPTVAGTVPPRRVTVRRDAGGRAVLADQAGAQVVLRGINVNQLGDYYAANPEVRTVEPLTEQDFADIAAMGFNAVRLVLSWSALEPVAGEIDQAYLNRVRQAVGWARTHGIHVVLDMHQDAWGKDVVAPPGTTCRSGTSPMTGWDGAPTWATSFDGASPCQFTGRDLAPNVLRAFTSFFVDRDGVQERLVAAWGRVAQEFGGDPTVAGYDLLNEPSFAEQAPLTSGLLLGRYHARAIRAIRAGEAQAPGGYAHPVFLEPSIWWSGFGVDPLPPQGFTTDPQLVFAPHLYHESITIDRSVGMTWVGIERGYALAERAAQRWGTPLWVGEWGSFSDPETNLARYERYTAAEDARRVGSAIWVWKQACGDPHAYPSDETGNIRRVACPEGTPLPSRPAELEPLRRAYPRSAPGRITTIRAEGRTLLLEGDTAGAGPVPGAATPAACTLDVWVPGTQEPEVGASTGITGLRAVSVPAGSPEQGPSGGWRVVGCASGAYRLTLS